MKKICLYILIPFLTTLCASARQATGSWRAHLSYHNITRSEPAGEIIYALGNGSLFSYNRDDTGIELYDKVKNLSDTDIATIAYSAENKALLIYYSNANIDILVNQDEVYNLPDFMNKNTSYDKSINTIRFNGEYAYLSFPFGIMQINMKKKEISNTFVLNKTVNDCTVDGDKIYAATDEGLYRGITTNNLLDVSNWEKVSDINYLHFTLYDGELFANIQTAQNDYKIGIYKVNKETLLPGMFVPGNYTRVDHYGGQLLCSNNDSFLPFFSKDKHSYTTFGRIARHVSYGNNTYWGSYGQTGLIGQKLDTTTGKLEDVVAPIVPDSPVRNLFNYMKFNGERLLVAGGGITGDRLHNPGTVMMMENNTWYNFDESAPSQTGLFYRDITSIVQDPKDPAHHFASSAGEGLYEFKEMKFSKLYNLANSPLQTALPNSSAYENYVRINALTYDSNNNLWMLNSGVESSVHVLKTDGTWFTFSFPETTAFNNFENILIDKRGWIWATSFWPSNSGVFCLKTNNTLDNTNDDEHRFISRFTNQDGTLLPQNGIYCLIEDKKDAIWIGTGQGPIVLNNPSRFFDSNFSCTQIKVSRDDGSGLADFLLANDIINDIAIDGANRKWIGTETNGIYLLSEDGQETIHHFTQDNSPLLSNNILSIAISPQSGEVFIATNKGLISYQSDATEAEESFDSNAYAYPNPVYPDYDGVITVTGMVRDSDVKITDAAGNVISSGKSLGGRFTWDGRNRQGRRVASGVYFILAADEEGKEGVVVKILVVR